MKKILKKVIYLGISDYDTSALLAESHYKANTDPAFRLVFYGNTDQNLRSILNLFPNEVNNVLIKLYLLYKEGKKEEIEKLSTEIIKIQNDEYFSNIIEVIYKDFKEKKDMIAELKEEIVGIQEGIFNSKVINHDK